MTGDAMLEVQIQTGRPRTRVGRRSPDSGLDEPFASLDRSLAGSLGKRLVDRVARGGTLVLLSTHDVDQALTTATRILVLSGEPAGLAADIIISDRNDVRATGSVRQDLLTRFAFLGIQHLAPPSGG